MSDASVDVPNFVAEGSAIKSELIRFRREMHRDPEVGLDLAHTQRRVLKALSGLDLEITTGSSLSSVVAVLKGEQPGPVVLLRGDMDALPISEETGLPFSSENPGKMHACGHDLHTSALIGAAKLLSAHRSELPGSVIFMFQPGEEGDGGAKIMLEEGLLDAAGERPVAAYAIHVCPGPFGVFGTKTGTISAGSNNLTITIKGHGGHGSAPNLAVDPVPVAAEVVLALQAFVTRRFDVFDPVVLSVTRLSTGDGPNNAIPNNVDLEATVRTLSKASVALLQKDLPELVKNIAAAHRCTADVDFSILYPATINTDPETANVIADLKGAFGDDRVILSPHSVMGSEDFSFVLEEVPGTFVGLMTSPAGSDLAHVSYNHSSDVIFDDGVLGDQAAALATMAFRRLSRG